MNNTAIQVTNLSKRYQLGTIGYGSLQRDLKAWWARTRGKEDPNTKIGERSRLGLSGEFWALRDVGFEVQKGDRIGIIGKNGAGKSTLLKLLSRVTAPTSGSIKIRGRVASLLEVGTGFHPELTGRENVFLNGAILGMRRREIQSKFDQIVSFAGVDQFIDTPVKRYSSGMYVRLAFSVAAHLDSEILIVDEVLAVGDAEFQKKCLGKMEDVSKGEGRTILFVSHNISAISHLCNSGLVLESGNLVHAGNVSDSIAHYMSSTQSEGLGRLEWQGTAGDADVSLLRTWVRPQNGTLFDTAGATEVGIEVRVLRPTLGLVLGFQLLTRDGTELAYVLYDDPEESEPPLVPPGLMTKRFVIPADTLAQGEYQIKFDVGIHMIKRIVHEEGMLSFSVDNLTGLGRRFLISKDAKGYGGVFRPRWAVQD